MPSPSLEQSGGNPYHDRIGFNILCHNRSRPNNAAGTNAHALDDHCVCPDPDIILDDNLLFNAGAAGERDGRIVVLMPDAGEHGVCRHTASPPISRGPYNTLYGAKWLLEPKNPLA